MRRPVGIVALALTLSSGPTVLTAEPIAYYFTYEATQLVDYAAGTTEAIGGRYSGWVSWDVEEAAQVLQSDTSFVATDACYLASEPCLPASGTPVFDYRIETPRGVFGPYAVLPPEFNSQTSYRGQFRSFTDESSSSIWQLGRIERASEVDGAAGGQRRSFTIDYYVTGPGTLFDSLTDLDSAPNPADLDLFINDLTFENSAFIGPYQVPGASLPGSFAVSGRVLAAGFVPPTAVPVPEPSSAALLLIAVTSVLAAMRWRAVESTSRPASSRSARRHRFSPSSPGQCS
jgi:hypothetical protein